MQSIDCLRHISFARQSENKAGYTAPPVSCEWAGAMMEKVTEAFGQEPRAQNAQKRPKYRPTNQLTDQPTDQPTDRQSERDVESRAPLPCPTLYKVQRAKRSVC